MRERNGRKDILGEFLLASDDGSVPNPGDGHVSVQGKQVVDSSVDGVALHTQRTEGSI